MQETQVRFGGWEAFLDKEMATHSSILAWRIQWTEEPAGLQSTGSQESDTTKRLAHAHHGQEEKTNCAVKLSEDGGLYISDTEYKKDMFNVFRERKQYLKIWKSKISKITKQSWATAKSNF